MWHHEQPEGWGSATNESHHALSEIRATVLDCRLNLQEHIALDASLNRLTEIAVEDTLGEHLWKNWVDLQIKCK